MKKLIGKKVRVFYTIEQRFIIYEGEVQEVKKNLVFLVNVYKEGSSRLEVDDQIVNTTSSAFVRFDILK